VIVEDCVSIGRAFGGGIAYPVVRPYDQVFSGEATFLRLIGWRCSCHIDWRSEKNMPLDPHLILEDCTLVHQDNALALSYAGYASRVTAIRCRFIVLNFTQPEMEENQQE